MEWKEESPDIHIYDFSDFFQKITNTIREEIESLLDKGNIIFFSHNSWESIWKHGKSSVYEVGGLLIGYIFRYKNDYFCYIDDIVYSRHYRSSTSHLLLFPQLWQVANKKILDLEGNLIKNIIGWYHTHPGFAPFYSELDKKTQKNFFNQEYSVGLVINPFSENYAIYRGKDSIFYPNPPIIHTLF